MTFLTTGQAGVVEGGLITPASLTHRSGRAQDFLIRIFDGLAEWGERHRQRYQLSALDDRMLRDVGLDPASVAAETSKAFWQR